MGSCPWLLAYPVLWFIYHSYTVAVITHKVNKIIFCTRRINKCNPMSVYEDKHLCNKCLFLSAVLLRLTSEPTTKHAADKRFHSAHQPLMWKTHDTLRSMARREHQSSGSRTHEYNFFFFTRRQKFNDNNTWGESLLIVIFVCCIVLSFLQFFCNFFVLVLHFSIVLLCHYFGCIIFIF